MDGAEYIPEPAYPYQEGDVTVIGPECFAKRDRSVLSWQGDNYVPQRQHPAARLRDLLLVPGEHTHGWNTIVHHLTDQLERIPWTL
jgi:hypothetical protein